MLIMTQCVSGKPVRARQEDNQEHIRSLTIGLLLLLCSIIIIITLLQADHYHHIIIIINKYYHYHHIVTSRRSFFHFIILGNTWSPLDTSRGTEEEDLQGFDWSVLMYF